LQKKTVIPALEKNYTAAGSLAGSEIYAVKKYFEINYAVRNKLDNPNTKYPLYEGSVGVKENNKLGWHDCITSVMACTQIAQNVFSLETRSDIGSYMNYLDSKGMMGKSIDVTFTSADKNRVQKSINNKGSATAVPSNSDIGTKLETVMGETAGTKMFLVDFFNGHHAATIIATTSVLPNDAGNRTTFKIFDETDLSHGGTAPMSAKQLNDRIAEYGASQLSRYTEEGVRTNQPDTRMNPKTTVREMIKKNKDNK
jgi:hypothetical protein